MMNREQELSKLFFEKGLDAFTEVYGYYSPLIYPICLRYTRGPADAKDVLQEIFIKIFEKHKQYKGKAELGAWIRRIAVNTALNYIRRNYGHNMVDSDEISETHALVQATNDEDREQLLMKLIQALPDGYRTVFSLYVFEELKHAEIAKKLGISENTSKSQLMKARKSLQDALEAHQIKY